MPNHPARVLLVDDEAEVLRVCAEALEHENYEVTVADSGSEARRAMASHKFDAAVLDLVLPDANGLELLSAIRETDPAVVVILMTGHASLNSAIEAVRGGAYDYMRKPFGVQDLVRVVRRGLSQRQDASNSHQPFLN